MNNSPKRNRRMASLLCADVTCSFHFGTISKRYSHYRGTEEKLRHFENKSIRNIFPYKVMLGITRQLNRFRVALIALRI